MAVTFYGVFAVTFMMAMYALEQRHPRFTIGFAFGVPALQCLRVPVRRVAVWCG
jgi:hypothetical protein